MNILDILYDKKQKCEHAGKFKSGRLIRCLRNKFDSKPNYCYKICEHYKIKSDEENRH